MLHRDLYVRELLQGDNLGLTIDVEQVSHSGDDREGSTGRVIPDSSIVGARLTCLGDDQIIVAESHPRHHRGQRRIAGIRAPDPVPSIHQTEVGRYGCRISRRCQVGGDRT